MTRVALATTGLTKRFGSVTAVEGVDLRVEAGEIYGFLGLNGAGKSTTIRLLLGMLRPTAGHAEVLGVRTGPGRPSPWHRVGYLVEGAAAYPELTVRENLTVAGWLHGIIDARPAASALERLGLGSYADRPARALSTGNLQRLALARALLHDPELVILDEPITGLDPAGVVEVRDLIRSLARDRGTTVFMSSHILTEVDRIATRVGIVHRGRLIEELSTTELDRRRRRRLQVATRDTGAAERILRGAGFEPVAVAEPASGVVLELADGRAVDHPDEVARLLVSGGAPPVRLVIVRDDMERVFLALTGDAPAPGGAG